MGLGDGTKGIRRGVELLDIRDNYELTINLIKHSLGAILNKFIHLKLTSERHRRDEFVLERETVGYQPTQLPAARWMIYTVCVRAAHRRAKCSVRSST